MVRVYKYVLVFLAFRNRSKKKLTRKVYATTQKLMFFVFQDDILKMLVKPMVSGVHCTVLMDCCHSGTVMDLPYKFGADDVIMMRETGFNMDKITDGEKGRGSMEPKLRKKKGDEDGDEKKKEGNEDDPKKKKSSNKKKKKKEEEEPKEVVVGPRIVNGVASLPVRKAQPKALPPPNSKQCSVM